MQTTFKTMPQIAVQIRWMIRRDMPEILRIEADSFENAWTADDFIGCLRLRNCIGMVATDPEERIVGYMIYELFPKRLELLNFAVAPQARRSGVGRQMIEKLKNKLSQQCRQEIRCQVRESTLPAQLFFRAMKFQCVGSIREAYEDSDEDAYLMSFLLAE